MRLRDAEKLLDEDVVLELATGETERGWVVGVVPEPAIVIDTANGTLFYGIWHVTSARKRAPESLESRAMNAPASEKRVWRIHKKTGKWDDVIQGPDVDGEVVVALGDVVEWLWSRYERGVHIGAYANPARLANEIAREFSAKNDGGPT